jgi:hypothetical protein
MPDVVTAVINIATEGNELDNGPITVMATTMMPIVPPELRNNENHYDDLETSSITTISPAVTTVSMTSRLDESTFNMTNDAIDTTVGPEIGTPIYELIDDKNGSVDEMSTTTSSSPEYYYFSSTTSGAVVDTTVSPAIVAVNDDLFDKTTPSSPNPTELPIESTVIPDINRNTIENEGRLELNASEAREVGKTGRNDGYLYFRKSGYWQCSDFRTRASMGNFCCR